MAASSITKNFVISGKEQVEMFKSLWKDWSAMVSAMISDYMNGGLFKQVIDEKMLLGLFQHFMQD